MTKDATVRFNAKMLNALASNGQGTLTHLVGHPRDMRMTVQTVLPNGRVNVKYRNRSGTVSYRTFSPNDIEVVA